MDFWEQQIDDYLERYLNPKFLLEQIDLPELEPELCAQALEEVLEPIRKLTLLPGKRWRPMLTLLYTQLGDSSEDALDALGPVVALVELLHNATLIADDIEDGGQLRRGIPALHLSYGLDRALNSCNWCYFIGSALLRPLQNTQLALRLQSLSSECLSHIHLGQALDIRWHRQHDYIPTPEEYFGMAALKTGALAGFAAEAGYLCATGRVDQERKSPHYFLWLRAGRVFQVLDDLLNITVGNPGKLRGDDLLEGKKSLPLCLFAHGAVGGTAIVGLQHSSAEKCAFLQRLLENVQTGEWPLDVALAELLRHPDAIPAFQYTASWLEAEFAACRTGLMAESKETPVTEKLLGFLDQLQAQLQLCRSFF